MFYLSLACALGALSCSGGGSAPSAPPSITTTTLPDGTAGQPYNQTLQATGGTGSLTWSLMAGSLPSGLSLSGGGAINGTPTAAGVANFTVQVQDSASPPRTATQALNLRIILNVLTITTSSLPSGTTGSTYDQVVSATGGVGPRSWSISGGALPGGLVLASASGVISGLPAAPGTSNFIIQVQDTGPPQQTVTRALSITVNAGPVSIATSSLPAGTVGVPYSAFVSAAGGTAPFTWLLQSGSLPNGLALNPATGEISGTTTNPLGNFTFQLRATDSATPLPGSATRQLSIRVAPAGGAGSLGRNDSAGNATPLSNGTYAASISPLADPLDMANPDNDIYRVVANGGAIVTVEVTAQLLMPRSSPLDSVIEIVDAAGTRLATCRTPAGTTGLFNELCMNDDIGSSNTDSRLEFQVPTGPPLTFLARVLDFRGDARPDFLYTITITGAN